MKIELDLDPWAPIPNLMPEDNELRICDGNLEIL